MEDLSCAGKVRTMLSFASLRLCVSFGLAKEYNFTQRRKDAKKAGGIEK
jgi:hypothetical protein